MDNKQVSFAKHNIFYKMFFDKHAKLLDSFINITFTELPRGYFNLLTFYSTYSYYLRDGSLIDKVIKEERDELINNKDYQLLVNKSNNDKKLEIGELLNKNNLYYNNLINIFEKFEDFCNKLAPDDLMPDLTESTTDYERNVLFASYETFYENFFNFHSKIGDLLNRFNIISFLNTFKSLMAFYYGHSYYISKSVQRDIILKFRETWNIYNNKSFMTLFYNLINNRINKNQMQELKQTQEVLFISINKIFDMINNDLPKQNMMPRKKEKINIDITGI